MWAASCGAYQRHPVTARRLDHGPASSVRSQIRVHCAVPRQVQSFKGRSIKHITSTSQAYSSITILWVSSRVSSLMLSTWSSAQFDLGSHLWVASGRSGWRRFKTLSVIPSYLLLPPTFRSGWCPPAMSIYPPALSQLFAFICLLHSLQQQVMYASLKLLAQAQGGNAGGLLFGCKFEIIWRKATCLAKDLVIWVRNGEVHSEVLRMGSKPVKRLHRLTAHHLTQHKKPAIPDKEDMLCCKLKKLASRSKTNKFHFVHY